MLIKHQNELLQTLLVDADTFLPMIATMQGLVDKLKVSEMGTRNLILLQYTSNLIPQDDLIRKYTSLSFPITMLSNLKSLLTRLTCRLKQQYERHKQSNYGHINKLETAMQTCFQQDPICIGVYIEQLFSYHRYIITDQLQPKQLQKKPILLKSKRKTSLITVLACNQPMYHCWRKVGRRNYEPMDIEDGLQQVFYFTRTKQQNSQNMLKDMLERNKSVECTIKQYQQQFKIHKNNVIKRKLKERSKQQKLKMPSNFIHISNMQRSIKSRISNNNMFRIRVGDQLRSKAVHPATVKIQFLSMK